MNLLIWVCIAQAAWLSVSAFYFTGMREVFKPPKALRNHSYFGYSITYDEVFKKLVISAPRENNTGVVYDCSINNRSCIPIVNVIDRVSIDNYTHDYWFGATVKAGRNFVMMCAPRYTEHYDHFGSYETFGQCFIHQNGTMIKKTGIREKDRILDSPTPMEATMDSFGWSIDVASDDSIIVGGPGMFHGRAMIFETEKYTKLIRKNDATPAFNFGYAVSSGAFINKNLSYAVSSTYGKLGEGEVAFFKSTTPQNKLIKKVDKDVIGSMYGAVLCAANLTGIKTFKTDLLVGAPAYASKPQLYNQGAVYVYISTKSKKPPVFKRKIVGTKAGSLFGSSIISLGDLNGDKRHEIAIGAPFENGKIGGGVVYLYSGADLISDKTDNDLKWMQRIDPEPSYANSFGMSLTTLLDYDQNGCNELAIGSPFTDRVVLFRCIAAINVTTTVTDIPNLQGRTASRKTDFEFKVCLLLTYKLLPEKITALLSTTVEMNHPYANLTKADGMGRFSFNTTLTAKKLQYCTPVPFTLPLRGKYETEISYQIETKLVDDPRGLPDFDSSRVILSDFSNLNLTVSMWAAECAGKTCMPNLNYTYDISFQTPDYQYIIGSSEVERIDIKLINHGEVAYDACVRVHIVGAFVFERPTTCEDESSLDEVRLKCAPPMPLENTKDWSTGKIALGMTHLTNLNKNVTFNIRLYNHCTDVNPTKTSIVVPVKAVDYGIVAKGVTDIGSLVNMTKEDVNVNGKKMQHIHTISNSGPTNWASLSIEVILPKQTYIKYDDGPPVKIYAYRNSEEDYNADCTFFIQEEKSMIYHCKLEHLNAKVESAKIFIPMFILPGTLDGILEKENVTITSTIKLLLDTKNKTESVTTTIMLEDAPTPVMTIIISVVIGLFILIIIALVLYKVGFLRREKKKELDNLRRSIRRQTVLRRSTMPKQSPRTGDRAQILEGMKEEDEIDLSKE